MAYDPALTAIGAATNDALGEHLWRYDTATDDPVGHAAVELARAAHDFTITADRLPSCSNISVTAAPGSR